MSENYDLTDLPEQPASSSLAKMGSNAIEACAPSPVSRDSRSDFDPAQWTALGPGSFIPSGRSFPALPCGFYRGHATPDGSVYASDIPLISDALAVLPGSCNETVLSGIREFWKSKAKYARHGLNYKRGVLFYGPPGSGKTATVTLLCKELIEVHNGAVFVCENPALLSVLLHKLRKIEPERALIVVMEDIDEIIHRHSEHDLLALLDGETQISNVVFLATTNYPDRLGGRIVNRPSRFDERIFVDMPSVVTRRAYLAKVTAGHAVDLDQWADDTQGMSISHLRELVVAVCCLGREYGDTLSRLRSMRSTPKTSEGLGRPIGIAV